ncbi:MAG: lytic transglycosylase domain-containing protein [Clostridiales bacterium]|nr:lytic transglycosylase domain-containing protein [Clostridiales bacterium]
MKRFGKLICLLLVLVLVGVGIYHAYFYFLKKAYPIEYEDIVTQETAKYEIEPSLVYAVIRSESSFRPQAKSTAGAMGLMQLTPETFQWLQTKVNPGEPMDDTALNDPKVNIRYGVYLLSLLRSQYDDETVVLCAYNAGMGNVNKWLKNVETSPDGETLSSIPIEETRNYVDRVLKSKEMYEKLYGDQIQS